MRPLGPRKKGKAKSKGRRSVLLRWDRRLRRQVVVKRYPDRHDAAREWRARTACGPSRYLVRFYRCLLFRRGGIIVMERIKGMSLREAIRRRGPFAPEQVIVVALRLLAALDVMHRRGVVHGDLHPGNVVVTDWDKGDLKIIDFQHAVKMNRRGKARALRTLPKPSASLAPESRQPIIDAAYDIYGVGFICASMLMGKEPNRRPRSMPDRRRSLLWSVILKSMHPDRRKRFRSAKAMAKALRKISPKAAKVASGDGS